LTVVGRILAGLVGAAIVVMVLDAAVRTFLLPRVANVRLSRVIAAAVGAIFGAVASSHATYRQKDRRLALYPPVLLLSYQACWLGLSLIAFALLFLAAGASSVARAAELSGSSLFTLGTTSPHSAAELALSYGEAAIGLTLLALLIAFIPTLYAAFQRREMSVSRLSVRAGVPATPWGIIELAKSVDDYGRLDDLWREWETWFIELRETHTTLTILNFYRTPIPDQTWIGSAAAVLDSAALYNAAVDLPVSPAAGLCIRSGWLAFRGLADYFRVEYPHEPDGTEPISIERDEFELVLDHLARSGVPILADHEQAWLDFAGWRVNYDAMLEEFHVLFTSPRIDWRTSGTQALFAPSNRRGEHHKGRTHAHPGS
jgi:putative flippase GtrA